MDYSELAAALNRTMHEVDKGWASADIWSKKGDAEVPTGHVFLSGVLAVIGDDPVDLASYSASDDGALVATVWTADLVVQGVRSSPEAELILTVIPRDSLSAMKLHVPPVLSMSGWGIHLEKHVVELLYPEFTAVFHTPREDRFIDAIGSFRRDL